MTLIIQQSSSLLVALLLLLPAATHAQFTCTFSGATDFDSCTEVTDDSSNHCVWCSVGGGDEENKDVSMLEAFGFCVSESQAEAMEQSIPNIHCDRYKGDSDDDETGDDAVPADDDAAPADDDDAPAEDDDTAPSDDDLPDNYWDCLTEKTAKDCAKNEGCTWCDTKAGFGLCMTGPSAESAANSDWFTCATAESSKELSDFLQDPMDGSCAVAFLNDPTEAGCTAALDQSGQPCEWCSLAGMTNVCLTAEQAQMGSAFGVTCDAVDLEEEKENTSVEDPYDPSCMLAYLQDQSKDACVAAVDSEGTSCEFCTLQGALEMCLNTEQAEMGEALGIECDAAIASHQDEEVNDPYDPSCMLAYLQDQSKEACTAAVDSEGTPCEFCTLQGSLEMCLNADQAEMGEALGIECEKEDVQQEDPFDPTCALAYYREPSKDTCVSTVDSEGNPCEFCTLNGVFSLCLNADQVEASESLGNLDCDSSMLQLDEEEIEDPFDSACAFAFLMAQSKEACLSAVDSEGNPCEYCTLQGALNLCLNADQAEAGESLGIECETGTQKDHKVELPPDFFDCLENYKEGDCRASSCTWCNTEVGMGFCLAPAAADATKECTFFDCEFGDSEDEEEEASNTKDIYDPICLTAGAQATDDPATVCAATTASDGGPCVWCDAAGVFGLCLSSEQAAAASQLLQCDASAAVAASA